MGLDFSGSRRAMFTMVSSRKIEERAWERLRIGIIWYTLAIGAKEKDMRRHNNRTKIRNKFTNNKRKRGRTRMKTKMLTTNIFDLIYLL